MDKNSKGPSKIEALRPAVLPRDRQISKSHKGIEISMPLWDLVDSNIKLKTGVLIR